MFQPFTRSVIDLHTQDPAAPLQLSYNLRKSATLWTAQLLSGEIIKWLSLLVRDETVLRREVLELDVQLGGSGFTFVVLSEIDVYTGKSLFHLYADGLIVNAIDWTSKELRTSLQVTQFINNAIVNGIRAGVLENHDDLQFTVTRSSLIETRDRVLEPRVPITPIPRPWKCVV